MSPLPPTSPDAAVPVVDRFADRAALTEAVALATLQGIRHAVAGHGRADVCLTGGSAGIEAIAALVTHGGDLTEEEWGQVHLWWGDERFVATGDTDRNVDQAREVGLDRLPIPAGHVHVMPATTGDDAAPSGDGAASIADLTAEAAAQAHAAEYEAQGSPSFDVLHLGVGPDAHVASLFPGRPELEVTTETVVAVHDSPKPPPTRLTFTLPVLRAASRVFFVVAGADKADAVAGALAGQDDPDLPASCVRGTRETRWFVDEAAAG